MNDSIQSVLNQTYANFELIIIDDGSTDNSWDIINSCTDPRIRPYQNIANKFYDYSDLLQLEQLKGEYLAVHHSDDTWQATKLEKQVRFLDSHPQYAAVFTRANIIDEAGHFSKNQDQVFNIIFDQSQRTRFDWLNYFFFHGNPLCHPSVLMRKACLQTCFYRAGLGQLRDLDMWVQLCLQSNIYVITEKLVNFRIYQDHSSLSGDRKEVRVRRRFERLQVLDQYRSISSADELLQIFPQAAKYINSQNADLLYALGRVALDTPTGPYHFLFGLNLLFEAVADPIRVGRLSQYNDFTQSDLIALTGQIDLFRTESIQELSAHAKRLQQVVQNLMADLVKKEEQIKALQSEIDGSG